MRNTLCVAIAIALLSAACSKKGSNPGSGNSSTDTTTKSTPAGPSVYFAGTYSNGSTLNQAAYWKNDTVHVLSSGDTYPAYAMYMTFSDSDVYATGDTDSGTVYWKNGKKVLQTGGWTANGAPSGIGLIGQNVYVGEVGTNNFGEPAVGYWKDGVYNQVWSDSNFAFCFSTIVANNNLYMVGFVQNTTTNFSVAKLWVNGVATDLTSDTGSGAAYGVYVSGSDVYVSGSEMDAAKTHYIAKYWKNGVPTVLQDSAGANIYASTITMSGSDMYITGNKTPTTGGKSIVGYWKNGSFVQLADTTQNYTIGNLVVLGTDVYVPYYTIAANGFYVGGYLKNGQPHILYDGVHTLGKVFNAYVH